MTEATTTLTDAERDQLAQETAEYIARVLAPAQEQLAKSPWVTISYPGDRRPPTTAEAIKAELLAGHFWVSWMDDRVTAAVRQLTSEPDCPVCGRCHATLAGDRLPDNCPVWIDGRWVSRDIIACAAGEILQESGEDWYDRELCFARDAHEMTPDLERAIGNIFGPAGADITDEQYARAAQLIACTRRTCGGQSHDHQPLDGLTPTEQLQQRQATAWGHALETGDVSGLNNIMPPADPWEAQPVSGNPSLDCEVHGFTYTTGSVGCPDCLWPAEFMLYGLRVGHACDDCERLTIGPAAIHTAGASYELVASITAGHTHDGEARDGGQAERGHVAVLVEDIPKVIAELQKIRDRSVQADAEQRIPPEWPVHH